MLIQGLYDKLKRRMMLNPLQNAANHSIDMQTIVFLTKPFLSWSKAEDTSVYQQSECHPYPQSSTVTSQRQQLYPRTVVRKIRGLTIDSPPGHGRPFGIRPPSHQGQGMRSAVVSAVGRTPLEKLSTNVTIGGYRGGPAKTITGRQVFRRKWNIYFCCLF